MLFKFLQEQDANANGRNDLDNGLIIYLAAAVKIGTKDALERARKTVHEFNDKLPTKTRNDRSTLRLKHVMLYHLLCIKNQEFAEALEVLSRFVTQHYEFLNAKASILIRLGRVEECIQTIDKMLESNTDKPRYIFTETVSFF